MKVYITASNRWSAMFFGSVLSINGHTLTSHWHNYPMTRTREIPAQDKVAMVDASEQAIRDSDVLLIISDPDMVPGGKFVDVGTAIGAGKRVILVGQRENLKMYNSKITVVEDHVELLKVLDELSAVSG